MVDAVARRRARLGGRGLVCLAFIVSLLSGCDRAHPKSKTPAAAAAPGRIVSLAPSITEWVFALGCGDRLVGVTTRCDTPPVARRLPKIGGYGEPNVERILAARPDLVIAPEEGALLAPIERLEALGIPLETLAVRSLEDLYAACERLGRRLGVAERARALARSLRERVERVGAKVHALPRPRVLVVIDHRPTIAAGPGTFIDALVQAAGGKNALEVSAFRWPQLADEALFELDPDWILDLSMAGSSAGDAAAVKNRLWKRLSALRAVREGRVVSADADLFVRPGPRLVDGLEWLAGRLHPEAFVESGGRAGAAAR